MTANRRRAPRVRAVLRRAGAGPDDEVLRIGGLVIDCGARSVARDGRPVELTPTQFDLLATLARRPGRAFSREELVERVLGPDYLGDGRAIDAHVKNLRRRLEPTPEAPRHVLTVFGVGYRFAEAPAGGGPETGR